MEEVVENKKTKIEWKQIIDIIGVSMFLVTFMIMLFGTYLLGFSQGYNSAVSNVEYQFATLLTTPESDEDVPKANPTPKVTPITAPASTTWGGPELWEVVNEKRQEYGVNPLSKRDELCTIASIRLNELIELGTLDGHEGFSNLSENRSDLTWIFEKYSSIAEFLALGGQTPQDTVSMWENTLGHKKLLTGGEYVWGCIYSQNTFAVAITAF